MSRPTTQRGDSGYFVTEIQTCLEIPVDSDFGQQTERAVMAFQTSQRIDCDGVVGPQTWAKLEEICGLGLYPPSLPPPLHKNMENMILKMAEDSTIARYEWHDRGVAPLGYTKGMAMAYATCYRKWGMNDAAANEMSKANTGNEDLDALAWYADRFNAMGMFNADDGIDTLRHLIVLLMGLGMRESSGQHCEGRDMSADNVQSDTAEAGLFQTSWNINTCCDLIQVVYDQYATKTPLCALHFFSEDVTCSESDWSCYGSGMGYAYQELAKSCPQFAVESTALGLRNRRQHWGPINRGEAEIMQEADDMFQKVEDILTGGEVA